MSVVTPELTKVQKLISDEEVTRVHANANFGSMTPRDVIAEGVLKYAFGYHSGSTQFAILREHGLLRATKPGSARGELSVKGQEYLRAAFPYPDMVAAGKALIDWNGAVVAAVAVVQAEIDEAKTISPLYIPVLTLVRRRIAALLQGGAP